MKTQYRTLRKEFGDHVYIFRFRVDQWLTACSMVTQMMMDNACDLNFSEGAEINNDIRRIAGIQQ